MEGDTKRKLDFNGKKLDFEEWKNCLSELKVKNLTKNKFWTLYMEFGQADVFGRTEVAALLHISTAGASDLIRKMNKAGLLKVVVGQGKGKYQFL